MGVDGERLVNPRLVKVRAGKRGAGWAVGTHGILTARHVVAPFINSVVTYCLAVPSPQPGAPEFDCTVVWEDSDRDLALLAIDGKHITSWTAVVGEGDGPCLAEPGTHPLNVVATGYPNATIEETFPHPEQAPGVLLPAGGAVSGHMPLDVDSSVPNDSALWQGMSGAVVLDRDGDGRIIGVVVRADDDRQKRRLYARPLPDPAREADFARALTSVGARPVLEAAKASRVRRLLAVWDEAGRPYRVGQVPRLGMFGARKARADIETHGDPYYPYVRRNLDEELAAVLERRVNRTDRRMLLLIGDAMSGKSRTGANALMTHPVLSNHWLLVPSRNADLREVADLAPTEGAVLWLDNLNEFTAGLDAGVLAYCADRPGLVVVATLRSELLGNFLDSADLRPAWAVVDDDNLVEQFELPGEWSEQDRQALAGAEPVIQRKVAKGLTLGEVLGAAEELRLRLVHAEPFARKAVAFTIIDWARTGLTDGIPELLAEQLWTRYLSKKDLLVLNNKDAEERHEDFVEALRWARAPIPGTGTMLVIGREGRLWAEDYLVAHPFQEQEEIPRHVWDAALDHALATGSPVAIATLAYQAAASGVYDVARTGLRVLAAGTGSEAPFALYNLGTLLRIMGDSEGATAAFQAAVESQHAEAAPAAAFGLGLLLEEQGDLGGSMTSFRAAVDSAHAEHAPAAAVRLGALLAEQGDLDGAASAYRRAIDSQHPEHAPEAAVCLGALLAEHGDLDGAASAYRRTIDSHHPEHAPVASIRLAVLLGRQGDLDGAASAYRTAVDSQHVDEAPAAAVMLGALLAEAGDLRGAATAYHTALGSRHREHAPAAAFNLGALLAVQGDMDGATSAYRIAVDSQHDDYKPKAATNLGALLAGRGDLDGAASAYRIAVDSHHADCAPAAAFNLGLLLAGQGDLDGAVGNYRIAVGSQHDEYMPRAAVNLGALLARQGDLDGAASTYWAAIGSHHPEQAPKAAINLGVLLARQKDLDGATRAYRTAVESQHTEYAPAAAFNLGLLFAGEGDLDGATTANRAVIGSRHPEYAPRAAVMLGGLLAAKDDLDGAASAYRTAVDSQHVEYAPRAEIMLGALLAGQGDLDGAASAYHAAIGSQHVEYAPAAGLSLGLLLTRQGDLNGAVTAYRAAIVTHHAGYAPVAAFNLGMLLERQGDLDGAVTAFRAAIATQHADYAPRAAVKLGLLLDGQGDFDGAATAYRTVLASQHANHAPIAAFNIGVLLEKQGDVGGAATAYRTAVNSQNVNSAPVAALNLGVLLSGQGDLVEAATAYRIAIKSGHAMAAPFAELLLGEYCSEDDLQVRIEHRKRAAASGNPDVLVGIAELNLAEGAVQAARRLLFEAVQAGSPVAGDYLHLFPQDVTCSAEDQALDAVLTSAEAGNTDSMNMLGLHAAVRGDLEHARSWWARSAAENDVIGRLLISRQSEPRR